MMKESTTIKQSLPRLLCRDGHCDKWTRQLHLPAAIACMIFLPAGRYALGSVAFETDDSRIIVSPDQVDQHVPRTMYGACMEDVNHEVYGGLYDQKIFGESFGEPGRTNQISGWSVYGGDWQVGRGTCQVGTDSGAKLVSATPAFADGRVKVDIRFQNPSALIADLLVCVRRPGIGADNFDGYEIGLNVDKQTVLLGKHLHDWHAIQERPAIISKTDWNHVEAQLSRSNIRIFLGGSSTPVIDYTDSDRPILSGRVGLRTPPLGMSRSIRRTTKRNCLAKRRQNS